MTLLWQKQQQPFFTHSSPNTAEFSSAVVQKINKEKGFFYLHRFCSRFHGSESRWDREQGNAGDCVCVRFFWLRALPLNQPQQVTCVQMRGEGAWTDLFSGSPPRSWGVKLNDRGDLNTREAHTLMYGPACWAVCWRSQGGVLNTLLMWPPSSISYWNISSLQHLSIRPHQYWWFFVELSIC